MARLLSNETVQQAAARAPTRGYLLCGELYQNSAAQFWFGLADELIEDFRECRSATLTSVSDQPLDPVLLRPEASLERALGEPDGESPDEVIRRAAADLDLFGPPGSVTIALDQPADAEPRILPQECIDAEIFSYLLAWLLRWAGLDGAKWNREHLAGTISAVDPARSYAYSIDFVLHSRHVSEGLYRRVLTIEHRRESKS